MTIPETIYIDYSIFSTYQTCREKARLSYVENLRPLVTAPPLDFGAAWHSGLEALYTSDMNLGAARKAFVDELRERQSALPMGIESDEKRSVERGLAMLEAYADRWRGEPYEVIRRPDTGEPYVEIGFAIYLMEWRGVPVMYVGRVDRIMRSKVTGKVVNVESKTTSQNIDIFMRQIKPNHQVTGYHLAAKRLGLDISGTLWDAVFVSSRKPNPKLGPYGAFGIDLEHDFGRLETRRSETDIEEFLEDLTTIAWEYCERRYGQVTSGAQILDRPTHWARNAPTACSQYGGCQFRDVCAANANPDLIRSNFRVEEWMPWKGITEDRVVKA